MTVAEYTILLIRSVIQKKEPPEKPSEISFEDLFQFIRKHKLENITFEAIKKLRVQPEEEILHKWDYLSAVNQAQTLVQENEKLQLEKAFEEDKIAYLPMKGWYLRDMYPVNDYRFMSDLDILIHRKDRKRAFKLMHRLGYSGGLGDYGSDDSYLKGQYLHVELHLDLINMVLSEWYDYYRTIWTKAYTEHGYAYRLNWSDYYIYMAVNFAKDYEAKGVGIRSLMDFYIFHEKNEQYLDKPYIDRELKTLNIKEIEEEAVKLSYRWFGSEMSISIDGEMACKVLGAGISGSSCNTVKSRFEMMIGNSTFLSVKKVKFVFLRAFPGMKLMQYKYPILEKVPLLLPVFWLVRWVRHYRRALLELGVLKKMKADQNDINIGKG